MVAKPKKSTIDESLFRPASVGGYLPSAQFAEVEFRAKGAPDDAPTIKVKIRTDITNDDIDALTKIPESGATVSDHWAQIAPLVLGWNVQHRAEDGVVYDVVAPAEAGPEVFRFIPTPLFWQINSAIIGRTYERVDPKASVGSAATESS